MVFPISLIQIGSRPKPRCVRRRTILRWSMRTVLVFLVVYNCTIANSFATENETRADRLFQLGITEIQAGRFEQALPYWLEALNLYETDRNLIQQARLSRNLATAYQKLNRPTEAEQYYARALDLYQTLQQLPDQADMLEKLGYLNLKKQNWAQSEKYYQALANLTRTHRQTEGLILALGNLAEIRLQQNDFSEAEKYLEEALRLSRATNDGHREALTLNKLGNLAERQENYLQAIRYFKQTLLITGELRRKDLAADINRKLGVNYYLLGDYAAAIEHFQISLQQMTQTNDLKGQSAALKGLGGAYYLLHAYSKARDYYQRALNIARSIGDLGSEAQATGNLALVSAQLGDMDNAVAWHRQELELFRKLNDRLGEARALANFGANRIMSGDYPTAIEMLKQSIALGEQLDDQRIIFYGQTHLGWALFLNKDLAQAEALLVKAIRLGKALRAKLSNFDRYYITLFDVQITPYRVLQAVLAAQGRIEEALEIAEQGRAQAFIRLLGRNHPEPAASNNTQASTFKFEQAQQLAQQRHAIIIVYSILPEFSKLYAWIISAEQKPVFVDIAIPVPHSGVAIDAFLQKQVKDALHQLSTGVRGVARATAQDTQTESALSGLSRLLLEKVTPALPAPNGQELIFIPQGPLLMLPFAALQLEDGSRLVDKFPISVAPSLQVLTTLHHSRRKPEHRLAPLVVGNPMQSEALFTADGRRIELSNLPGAQAEAKAVAKLLQTAPLLGVQANKETVLRRMPGAGIIHLATHGLLEDYFAQGVPGALVLAPSATDSGLLLAAEIERLTLNSDLVVLSACDTGSGRITGDGVVGLSRSFLGAGAASVIVSLWSVPDMPTEFLMKSFYQQLISTGNKAEALQQAMLATRERFPAPVNWAGFILIGSAQ
ncbi:MAG: CHAT domain-containing protein [Burkholderiales bacterium]|nr:CHAT domain-containing protein [Burkholderiales bacterium]